MDKLNRIMALDIGDKTNRGSIFGPLWYFCVKTELILREKNNDKKALDIIEEYCKTYNVLKIVVGVPYNMDGTFGFQAKKNIEFIEPLKGKYEIIYQDDKGLLFCEAEEMLKLEKKNILKTKDLLI